MLGFQSKKIKFKINVKKINKTITNLKLKKKTSTYIAAASSGALSEGEMLVHSPPCENRLVFLLLSWFNWEQAEVYANER